jgi:ribosomal protein L7/L12
MAFGRRKSENASSPADLPSITHEKHAEIRSLLERGMKIQAIQRYREATGTGLAEAKSYVDQLGRAA